MSTLKERDRLETLERPVEEKKRAGRGLWLAAAALVVVVAATVGGFMVFGSGEKNIDFDVTSDYVPAGAAELEGIVTGPVIALTAPTSNYVPGPNELRVARVAMAEPAIPISTYVPGRHELRDALAAPGIDIEFSLPFSYVPIGANELEMALAEPGIGYGVTSDYVPVGANELEMAMAEPSIFDMSSSYVPGPNELAEDLAETHGSADQLQYR